MGVRVKGILVVVLPLASPAHQANQRTAIVAKADAFMCVTRNLMQNSSRFSPDSGPYVSTDRATGWL